MEAQQNKHRSTIRKRRGTRTTSREEVDNAKARDSVGVPGWDASIMLIDENMLASLREEDDDEGTFFRELIEAFLEHAECLRHRIEVAHRKREDAAFHAAMHNLKGGSLNIGAFALGTLSRAIDQAHRKGQDDIVDRGMQVFPDVFSRTMTALLNLLGDA